MVNEGGTAGAPLVPTWMRGFFASKHDMQGSIHDEDEANLSPK